MESLVGPQHAAVAKGRDTHMKRMKVLGLLNGASKTKLSKTLAIVAAVVLGAQQAGAQNLLWATSYSGISASALEEVEGVVADNSGNVFATGLSGGKGIGSGIRTMKLDARGNILWNVIHTQPALCGGMWGRTPLALDAAGNLYFGLGCHDIGVGCVRGSSFFGRDKVFHAGVDWVFATDPIEAEAEAHFLQVFAAVESGCETARCAEAICFNAHSFF
jgi:hypothetical protein